MKLLLHFSRLPWRASECEEWTRSERFSCALGHLPVSR